MKKSKDELTEILEMIDILEREEWLNVPGSENRHSITLTGSGRKTVDLSSFLDAPDDGDEN